MKSYPSRLSGKDLPILKISITYSGFYFRGKASVTMQEKESIYISQAQRESSGKLIANPTFFPCESSKITFLFISYRRHNVTASRQQLRIEIKTIYDSLDNFVNQRFNYIPLKYILRPKDRNIFKAERYSHF